MFKIVRGSEMTAAIRKVVEDRGPDFIYQRVTQPHPGRVLPTCLYAHPVEGDWANLEPGCGVGAALAHMGVSVDILARLDRDGGAADTEEFRAILLCSANMKLDDDAVKIAAAFQAAQDQGVAYGEAMRGAGIDKETPGE